MLVNHTLILNAGTLLDAFTEDLVLFKISKIEGHSNYVSKQTFKNEKPVAMNRDGLSAREVEACKP